jgi:hypothetical protein
LKTLSPEAATQLVGTKGVIYLDGIDAIDEEVAMILVTHRGGPDTGFVLNVNACRGLSANARAAVGKSRHVRHGNWLESSLLP